MKTQEARQQHKELITQQQHLQMYILKGVLKVWGGGGVRGSNPVPLTSVQQYHIYNTTKPTKLHICQKIWELCFSTPKYRAE